MWVRGVGMGMRLQLGHRTKPGQDLIGSSGLARHSSAPLALLPHRTSHHSVCSGSPTNLSLPASKEVREGGAVGQDAQPGYRPSMRRLPYTAGDEGYLTTVSQAGLGELNACSLTYISGDSFSSRRLEVVVFPHPGLFPAQSFILPFCSFLV